MDPTADLLRRIEEFIAREGMTPTAFGRSAAGDPGFVFWLRKGREPRKATREKALRFMAGDQVEAAA